MRARLFAAGALALGAAALWVTLRGTGLAGAQWSFFADYRGHSFAVLASPFAGQLELVPALIHKAVFEFFGPSAHALRTIVIALNLACAFLLYRAVRESLGVPGAVAAAALLAALGASAQVIGSGAGIGVLCAVAAGLLALLAIERRGGRADLLAAAALAVALASDRAGLAFAAGAATALLLSGAPGRRWWIVGAPLALLAAWGVWALGRDALGPLGAVPPSPSLSTLGNLPATVAALAAAALMSVTGMFALPGGGVAFDPVIGASVTAAAAILVWLRLTRGDAPERSVWIYVTAVCVLWLVAAAYPGGEGSAAADAARFQYPAAALVIVIGARLAAGIELGPLPRAALAAVWLSALAANALALADYADLRRGATAVDRAELSAIEIARDRVDPALLIEPLDGEPHPPGRDGPHPRAELAIGAGPYLSAAGDLGSPAYTEAELAAAPAFARLAADRQLIRALGLRPSPLRGGTAVTGCPRAGREARIAAGSSVSIESGGLAAAVSLRRFGDEPVPVGTLEPGLVVALHIPADRSSRPWRLTVTGPGASVCEVS